MESPQKEGQTMTRTLGTIETELGIAAIKHNDETGDLTCSVHDGPAEHIEWTTSKSWRKAYSYVRASYLNERAYHDSWVLCLRPVAVLKNMRSEASLAASAA